MKTIRFPALCLAACLAFASAAQATNLLTNGDFETNAFPPWVTTGDTQISAINISLTGLHTCGMGLDTSGSHTAKIEQTVVTTPGSLYYLALDVAGSGLGPSLFTMSGAPAAGGAADGSRDFDIFSGIDHKTLMFHATSASTKIAISMAGAGALIDNIQLIELPSNKRAGKYTGTAQTVLGSAANGATNKATVKLVARISASGQMVILEGATHFNAGILLPDGTLDIRLHGGRQVLSTTIQGPRIQFSVNGAPNTLDEGGNELGATLRTTYTLTRVK